MPDPLDIIVTFDETTTVVGLPSRINAMPGDSILCDARLRRRGSSSSQ